MVGFLSVELPSGLIIRNLRLMVGPQGSRWLAMPAQQRATARRG
jgi:DNA-binding cell septation regulator SpoVG